MRIASICILFGYAMAQRILISNITNSAKQIEFAGFLSGFFLPFFDQQKLNSGKQNTNPDADDCALMRK